MARNEMIELFKRFSAEQSRKDREVLEVRVIRKRGIGRALVKLPGCDQEVVAREPTPIACGASAQAVVNRTTGATTILPGPRSEAGQVIRVLKKQPVPVPPPPDVDTVQFLILFRDFGGELFYDAYRADGTRIVGVGDSFMREGVGTSFFPEVADDLGPGVRIMKDEDTGDLVVIDFLGTNPPDSFGSEQTYTPPVPWVVTNPQKVGDQIYWMEFQETESSLTTPVRLMKSDAADLAAPTVVTASTISSSPLLLPDWSDGRGPDFTTEEAALWMLNQQGSAIRWTRFMIPLAGGALVQRTPDADTPLVPSVIQAGHAMTGSLSATQTSTEFAPGETTAFEASIWNGDPDDDITTWASVGDIIGIAPDADPEFKWVLKVGPPKIERYNSAGALQETITLDEALNPIGLHYLTPEEEFDIPIPPEEEE